MNISRTGSRPSTRGPAEYFSGTVWFDEIAGGAATGRIRMVRVTFEPGARTAWHTHPHGQILHIMAGVGWVQRSGGEVTEVRAGDTVWFEAGERHWHGASSEQTMVHLAIQQVDDAGASAHWQEQVSAADYSRPRA